MLFLYFLHIIDTHAELPCFGNYTETEIVHEIVGKEMMQVQEEEEEEEEEEEVGEEDASDVGEKSTAF